MKKLIAIIIILIIIILIMLWPKRRRLQVETQMPMCNWDGWIRVDIDNLRYHHPGELKSVIATNI